jgi:uncharacterized protein (TIGR00645 family)
MDDHDATPSGNFQSETVEAEIAKSPLPAGWIERHFESFLFSTRWIAAPIYLGLSSGLFMLLVVFIKEVVIRIVSLPTMSVHDAILAVLGFIDVALVTNLLLMVILVGYEHFVSKLDIAVDPDRQVWITREDFAGLKLKLFASIIGITGIELLKAFMEIRQEGMTAAVPSELVWLVAIHVTFLFTALISAIADRLSQRSTELDTGEGGPDSSNPQTQAH